MPASVHNATTKGRTLLRAIEVSSVHTVMIVNNKPPHWEKLVKRFPKINWVDTVIAYAPNLHAFREMPQHLYRHELHHISQQEAFIGKVEGWWEKYLTDPEFVKSQESEAYRVQSDFIKATVTDRNKRAVMLNQLVKDFSGELYNHVVTPEEAKKIIM